MPAPLIVQAVSGTGTASPVPVTLAATTAHNCLVVCIGEGNSTTNPTVAGITLGGSAGNFALGPSVKNNADANAEIWTDQDCAGGQTAVSVSFNSGTGAGNGYTVWVFEVSGVLTTGAIDGSNAGGAASGAWSSGSTATLAQASEIAIGVGAAIGAAGAPAVAGPSSPWLNQATVSAARTTMVAGTQVLAATTALAYAGTASGGRVGAAIVTLLGASAAAGTVQPRATLPAPRRAPSRAVIRFTPVTTTNAAPPVPVAGTVQPRATLPAPRRAPSRAVIRFTPVTTTNAAARPAGKIQPRPTVQVPRRRPSRAVVRFTPVSTTNAVPAPRQLLISLASRAGTDDYGNTFPQGILATAGVVEGPVLIGSDAFFYSPAGGFGNLTQSVTAGTGTDQYGNAWLTGTTTYADNGSFWSAVSISGGVVNWYKATGPGGPWVAEAGIGFTFNALTGGGLSLTAPAGLSGSFAIPQPSPAATSAAIISALFAAGIFN